MDSWRVGADPKRDNRPGATASPEVNTGSPGRRSLYINGWVGGQNYIHTYFLLAAEGESARRLNTCGAKRRAVVVTRSMHVTRKREGMATNLQPSLSHRFSPRRGVPSENRRTTPIIAWSVCNSSPTGLDLCAVTRVRAHVSAFAHVSGASGTPRRFGVSHQPAQEQENGKQPARHIQFP